MYFLSSLNTKNRSAYLSQIILVGLGALLFVLTVFQTIGLTANSKEMALAEKSLLLDGQVVGKLIVVVGERGHILLSEDHGKTWQQQAVPTQVTLTSVFFVDPLNGWAAGHDSVILRTEDGGYSWRNVYSNPDDGRPILDLWFSSKDTGYATGGYGLFLETADGGESWHSVDFNPVALDVDDDVVNDSLSEDSWVDFHLNNITSSSDGRIYISAEAGNIYRSDDGGRSWLSVPSPYEGSFYGSLPKDYDELLMFGLRGNLFFTEDAGASWVRIDSGTQSTLNDGIRLADGRTVIAGLAGTLLVGSDDMSFESYAQPDRAGIAKVLQAKDDALILIGEQGARRLIVPARSVRAVQ